MGGRPYPFGRSEGYRAEAFVDVALLDAVGERVERAGDVGQQ
jgi:hypothetical protein